MENSELQALKLENSKLQAFKLENLKIKRELMLAHSEVKKRKETSVKKVTSVNKPAEVFPSGPAEESYLVSFYVDTTEYPNQLSRRGWSKDVKTHLKSSADAMYSTTGYLTHIVASLRKIFGYNVSVKPCKEILNLMKMAHKEGFSKWKWDDLLNDLLCMVRNKGTAENRKIMVANFHASNFSSSNTPAVKVQDPVLEDEAIIIAEPTETAVSPQEDYNRRYEELLRFYKSQ